LFEISYQLEGIESFMDHGSYATRDLCNRRQRCTGERSRGGDPPESPGFCPGNPDEKHQYPNKGDKPFTMICGVPKEFE